MYREIYARWKKGQEAPVDGNSIKNWNALSPAQCENLMGVGLRTIEDVAQAPDDSMRRYGIGIQELKNKAKAWLQAAKDHGPLTEEITKLKTENLQLISTIEALQDKIDLLSTQVDAQSDAQKPFVEKVAEIMEEATPAERYEAKFGKKPHHLMKDETILKKLQE